MTNRNAAVSIAAYIIHPITTCGHGRSTGATIRASWSASVRMASGIPILMMLPTISELADPILLSMAAMDVAALVMKLPDKPSDSFKRANPHLYAVGRLETNQPKPVAPQTLVSSAGKRRKRKDGVVCVITLVALRHRLLDDDNNVASFKPLRDSIAKEIGVDDGDKRLRWEYGQQHTTGTEGVMVRIQSL